MDPSSVLPFSRYALPGGSAKFSSVRCEAGGELRLEGGAAWPACRPYVRCPFAPASSAGSNWILNSPMPAVENTKIKGRENLLLLEPHN